MDNGPVLELFGEKGEERAALSVNGSGAAGLTLMDNGTRRALLMYASDDHAGVEFHDRKAGRSGFLQSYDETGFRRFDDPALPPAGPKP